MGLEAIGKGQVWELLKGEQLPLQQQLLLESCRGVSFKKYSLCNISFIEENMHRSCISRGVGGGPA